MEITDVRVRKITKEKEGKVKAVVSITLDNEFAIHDIKVIEGDQGYFIAMPSRRTLEGEYRDCAHPINAAMREKVQNAVLKAYEDALAKTEQEETEEFE